MSAPDHFAPVTDLGHGDALAPWRFLVGPKAQVRLLTAMGDFFLLKPHGFLRRPHVFLLDTFTGQCLLVCDTWKDFKRRMAAPDPEATAWRLHVNVSGQIFEQVKDLPPGTPIEGIDIKWQ